MKEICECGNVLGTNKQNCSECAKFIEACAIGEIYN